MDEIAASAIDELCKLADSTAAHRRAIQRQDVESLTNRPATAGIPLIGHDQGLRVTLDRAQVFVLATDGRGGRVHTSYIPLMN